MVATAEFDPGIAPFDVEVRRVPIPVTNSEHFIITLYRGEYEVTSHRAFWAGHTPEQVTIRWDCMEHFEVQFDDDYTVNCDWRWGEGATWSTVSASADLVDPGLSAYYFAPREPVPDGCEPAL